MAKKSRNPKSKSEVLSEQAEMKELLKIYEDAKAEGIFLVEGAKTSFGYIAAAGSIKKVLELERQMKKLPEYANQPDWELDLSCITMERSANLGTLVGTGKTRAQACRNAIKVYKKYNKVK